MGVKVLERHQNLRRVEADGREREAVLRLPAEEGVEVSAGAVVDEEARVVGGLHTCVESREEWVVEGGEQLRLRPHLGQPLFRQGVPVDDLESEGYGAVARGHVLEPAEVDAGEVAGAEVADELEVVEVEGAVGGEAGGGGDGRPLRVAAPVGPFSDVGGVSGDVGGAAAIAGAGRGDGGG